MSWMLTMLCVHQCIGTVITAVYTWSHRHDNDWKKPEYWWDMAMFSMLWFPYSAVEFFRRRPM